LIFFLESQISNKIEEKNGKNQVNQPSCQPTNKLFNVCRTERIIGKSVVLSFSDWLISANRLVSSNRLADISKFYQGEKIT